ncbi:MAG TPA: serine/threonine-protein kinase [Anaerolineales bacterium]|nr:serine/threonine-protein kinase [Anaerolineales bacterium]
MNEKYMGPYRIIALLGQGGMAQVFRAEHAVMEREVALKELLPVFLSEPQAEARFLREAKLLAKLEHSAIVPIYDSGKDEQSQRLYLVMRLMKGGSLDDRLKAKGKLSVIEYLPILQRVVQALTFAHKNNVVHRDLKPGNVMFDGEGQAYLSDFGIAHVAQQTVPMTATGARLGTPQYMAPEQFDSGLVDGRTDQYALAVMSYQVLTGKRPFDADTLARLMKMHLLDAPPALTLPDAKLGDRINAVLQKALAKEPSERFTSCTAFLQAFEQAVRASQPRTLPTQLEATLREATWVEDTTVIEEAPAWQMAQPVRPAPPVQHPTISPPAYTAPQVAPNKKGMPVWMLGCAGVIALAMLGFLGVLALQAMRSNSPTPQSNIIADTASPLSTDSPTRRVQQPTSVSSSFECAGVLPTRLQIGQTVQVPAGQDANAVWRDPYKRNEKLGLVAPKIPFEIIDGPVCDEYVWWRVHLPNGIKGWTAESDQYTYWLEVVR